MYSRTYQAFAIDLLSLDVHTLELAFDIVVPAPYRRDADTSFVYPLENFQSFVGLVYKFDVSDEMLLPTCSKLKKKNNRGKYF